MDANCLFCKIGAKKIPAKLVLDEEEIFAFEDINPQAPTHILLCPRKHFASLHEASEEDAALLGKLQMAAAKIAKERGLLAGIARCSTTGAARGSLCFICTCICWVDGISAGRRDRRRGG